MASFKFDPSKPGLRKIYNEYQELALRYVWEVGEEGVGSRKVWETVSERLIERKKASRASIIMFLEKLRKQGVLGFKDETGKGGYRRIYYPLMDEKGFVKLLLKTIVESMQTDFADETIEVIKEFLLANYTSLTSNSNGVHSNSQSSKPRFKKALIDFTPSI